MRSSAAERLALGLLVVSVGACTPPGMRVPSESALLPPLPDMTGPAEGLTALPWTLRELGPGATTAIVLIPDATCHDVEGARTRAGATEIEVTVLGRTEPGCTSTVESIAVIRLPEPLGSRVLRPGPAPPN